MTITVNGQDRQVEPGATVASLLRDAGLPADKVAVEVNGRLRRTGDYYQPLAEGDQVEIVTFVGGG